MIKSRRPSPPSLKFLEWSNNAVSFQMYGIWYTFQNKAAANEWLASQSKETK